MKAVYLVGSKKQKRANTNECFVTRTVRETGKTIFRATESQLALPFNRENLALGFSKLCMERLCKFDGCFLANCLAYKEQEN